MTSDPTVGSPEKETQTPGGAAASQPANPWHRHQLLTTNHCLLWAVCEALCDRRELFSLQRGHISRPSTVPSASPGPSITGSFHLAQTEEVHRLLESVELCTGAHLDRGSLHQSGLGAAPLLGVPKAPVREGAVANGFGAEKLPFSPLNVGSSGFPWFLSSRGKDPVYIPL